MKKSFVICVDNQEYPASLEVRKVYEVIADEQSKSLGLVRVIDESGEDYLYPQHSFVAVEFSESVEDSLLQLL